MDQFFNQNDWQGDMLWFEAAVMAANRSAFVKYEVKSSGNGSKNGPNSNKRMLEFLKKNWSSVVAKEEQQPEKERCYRHMINERTRREKQKQSYLALHSILPSGTKSDKKSIIETAAKEIEVLRREKEELERRKAEIEGVVMGEKEGGGAKIRVRVANPTSGVDSMVEVLRCLKKMGCESRAIRSNFSNREFTAMVEIESKIGAAEVEEAVHRTLFEVERKLLFHFPRG